MCIRDSYLPTREESLHEIYDRASKSYSDDSFMKLHRLAADMRGQIEKPGITVNNTTTVNKVMVIPVGKLTEQGTVDADDWSNRAISQQETLISQ